MKCHDDKIIRHSDIRETLKKIKKITFWDSIVKDIIKYVQEYLLCQKKRSNKKLNIRQEINRLKEV